MRCRMIECVCLCLCAALAASGAFAQEQGQQRSTSQQSAPTSPPARIRIGGNVAEADLIHKVDPAYPPIAKTAHIQGTVVLQVIVGKDGAVNDGQFVSGPPVLMRAAMDAVRQWRYKPTLLNGEPVEVDTSVNVVFSLGADEPTTEQSVSIDPHFKKDILYMFVVMHLTGVSASAAREAFQSMRPAFIASLPETSPREQIADDFINRLIDVAESPEAANQLAEIYARYFNDEQIKALTQFFSTPAGLRYNEVALTLAKDASQMGRQVGVQNASKIWGGICKDYPELKEKIKYCP